MNITSKDYLGRICVLTKSGEPVTKGSDHKNFRGDLRTVRGGSAPHKAGSEGKVLTNVGELYPSVFGMKWVVQS
jgi:hypothetical protein